MRSFRESIDLMAEKKKVKRQDVKNLLNKRDDEENKELIALLADNPVKYVKKLIANENLESIITKYLKVKGINKTDPDLQLFVTALHTLIKVVHGESKHKKK